MAISVYIPTSNWRVFPFLHILSSIYGLKTFYDGHSDWCEVVSHCRFDLHFSDNEWCWAPFQVLVRIIGMILNLIIWSGQMKFWLLGSYMHACSLSHVPLFATSWAVACQAPMSMAPSRQEYWSELPFPTQRLFPTQGLNLCLLCLLQWQADSSPHSHLGRLVGS